MAPQTQQTSQNPPSDDGLNAAFNKFAPTAAPTPPAEGDNGLNASFNKAVGAGTEAPAAGGTSMPKPTGILENVLAGAAGIGKEVAAGLLKPQVEAVGGLANLTARAAEKILGKPEGSLQAGMESSTDTSSVSSKIGEAGGQIAQYVAGEEALGALVKMTQLPEKALALAEKYPTVFQALTESKAAKIAGKVAGSAAGKIAGGAAKGAALGAATQGAQAASGGSEKAAEGAKAGAEGGAIGGAVAEAPSALLEGLQESKLGRGMVNRSLGATDAEVKYASPAEAIDREGIWRMGAGDWNALLKARRAGLPLEEQMKAAGGRFGAVASKIEELAPQLNQQLAQSPTQISVADAIDKPLQEELDRIINQQALTEPQRVKFLNKIAPLEKAWHDQLGSDHVSPTELNKFKQDVGEVMSSWGKDLKSMPEDNIQRTYLAVYEAAKDAVNHAVPQAASLNERVSNLIAARNSLEKLIRAQEAGQTAGPSGSTHGVWAPWSLIREEMGRMLPISAGVAGALRPGAASSLPPLAAGYSRVLLSNGALATLPTENLQRLQVRDPHAQVLESTPTQNTEQQH